MHIFSCYFQVHLLDYANRYKVAFNDLKKWSSIYSYLPFQAIEFTIANVKADPDVTQKEATAVLARRMLKKQMQALVIQNIGDIVVQLYDEYGDDVGEFLVAQKLAKRRKFEMTLSDQNCVFPQ